MKEKNLVFTSSATVCVFDECGGLIGTIHRPIVREPLGPGREKVYLERGAEQAARSAA